MANPQKENGYTAVANELLEQLYRQKLNGTQYRIVLSVLRHTYGFQKTEHELSETFLANDINVNRQQLCREIRALIDMKIITVVADTNRYHSRVLKINKNYEEWGAGQCIDIQSVSGFANCKPNSIQTVSGLASNLYADSLTKKEKEKRKNKEIYAHFEILWNQYPRKKGKSKVSDKAKRRIEELGYDKVSECICRYKNEIAEKRMPEQYVMYGSTFFNGGFEDYMNDAVQSVAEGGEEKRWE